MAPDPNSNPTLNPNPGGNILGGNLPGGRAGAILLMFLKPMILWNFVMIYETLILILVSSQSYLKIKSIANVFSISIDYFYFYVSSKNQKIKLI